MQSMWRTMALALCIIAVMFSGHAQLVSSQQVGDLEIQDRGEGLLALKARCVSTEDLLEEIGKYGTQRIVLDQPCRTYVTINSFDDVKTVEQWVRAIAIRGMRGWCFEEDDVLHVRVLSASTSFDPSLTEQEVLQKWETPAPQISAVVGGIETGCVLLGGHLISPPYRIDAEQTSLGQGAQVRLNGALVADFALAQETEASLEVPQLPVTGQFENGDLLMRYVTYSLYPSLRGASQEDDAVRGVMEFLATQEIVARTDPGGDARELTLRFREWPDVPIRVFPLNYEFETGTCRTDDRELMAPSARADLLVSELEGALEGGKVIAIGRPGPRITFGGSSLAAFRTAVSTARGLPLLKAECIYSELFTRSLARRFAVNVEPYYPALERLLDAIVNAEDEGGEDKPHAQLLSSQRSESP